MAATLHGPGRAVEAGSLSFVAIDAVTTIRRLPSMFQVYGKRIIVVGAGAQVGQVALGAIGEADRHNIRGEKISIDTIPIGGEVTDAADELRGHGIMVVSLNMAGSVPDHADLVVTDPVQAGVMAVMAVASTASFDIHRVRGRRY